MSTLGREGEQQEARQLRQARSFIPESNGGLNRKVVMGVLLHVSIFRTLYWSIRCRGWCVLARGTRLKMGPGARICISRRSYLFLGFAHFAPTPFSMQMGRNAKLSIHGTAQFHRGVRVAVNDNAHLEIGTKTFINECSTVTCFEHIKIGAECAISWNTNIMDANIHELVIAGRPRPRSAPVCIGDKVWIGSGTTILAGSTIGEQSVIAAASVVTADVPSRVLVAGNPARIIANDAHWEH